MEIKPETKVFNIQGVAPFSEVKLNVETGELTGTHAKHGRFSLSCSPAMFGDLSAVLLDELGQCSFKGVSTNRKET